MTELSDDKERDNSVLKLTQTKATTTIFNPSNVSPRKT